MIKNITKLLLAVVLFASCNQYEKTPSGMTYKITKGGSKEKIKQGQFVKMHLEYRIKSSDTVLQGSYGHIPVYFPYDTAQLGKHTFAEIVNLCASGDKAEFSLSIDTLKNMNMLEYNQVFKQRDMINGKMEIIKVFNTQEEVKADYEKELELEKQREIKDLQAYAAKNNIKTQSTKSGVLVEVQKAGEGQKGDSGWQVTVLYKGYSKEGKVFDTNMDPKGQNTQPYPVIVGSRSVIPGWEEAFPLFGKGGKGRILVPAMLAYGPQGNPPRITPYANLIFDIEIVDVVKPAPKPASATPPVPGQ